MREEREAGGRGKGRVGSTEFLILISRYMRRREGDDGEARFEAPGLPSLSLELWNVRIADPLILSPLIAFKPSQNFIRLGIRRC